jgi:hypothetical protein
MCFQKKLFSYFWIVIITIFELSGFANAGASGLSLNYEALKVRVMAEEYIGIMETLKETLQFCEILLPIQIQAEIEKKGNSVISAEKIYKSAFALRSSREIFKWYLEFLSENEKLRAILKETFQEPGKIDEKKATFRLGATEFSLRWFWLYPTKNGLTLTAQDEMTQTIANEIWESGILRYIIEVRIPLPEKLMRTPFWEKGTVKIFRSFPSACVLEDPPELVYTVFPNSSGIPAIIQRTLELNK